MRGALAGATPAGDLDAGGRELMLGSAVNTCYVVSSRVPHQASGSGVLAMLRGGTASGGRGIRFRHPAGASPVTSCDWGHVRIGPPARAARGSSGSDQVAMVPGPAAWTRTVAHDLFGRQIKVGQGLRDRAQPPHDDRFGQAMSHDVADHQRDPVARTAARRHTSHRRPSCPARPADTGRPSQLRMWRWE